MSANKLSYEKFTKELRKNYDEHTIESYKRVYETICNSLVTFS